jgi:hypothetical protein
MFSNPLFMFHSFKNKKFWDQGSIPLGTRIWLPDQQQLPIFCTDPFKWLTWKKEVFGPPPKCDWDRERWCYPSRKAQFRVCVCFISVQVVFSLDDFFLPFWWLTDENLCIKNLFNWVSDWVYAYICPLGLTSFFKIWTNPKPSYPAFSES